MIPLYLVLNKLVKQPSSSNIINKSYMHASLVLLNIYIVSVTLLCLFHYFTFHPNKCVQNDNGSTYLHPIGYFKECKGIDNGSTYLHAIGYFKECKGNDNGSTYLHSIGYFKECKGNDNDSTYLHSIGYFKECKGHASSNDHLIHFIQHVLDQLDLICYLGSE